MGLRLSLKYYLPPLLPEKKEHKQISRDYGGIGIVPGNIKNCKATI
jgi:hypothetical protein